MLDEKKHDSDVVVNSEALTTPVANVSEAQTLWHDNVGYVFDGPKYPTVSVQTGNKTGNWSDIGTSKQPAVTVDLFSAQIVHTNLSMPVSYTTFPSVDAERFEETRSRRNPRTILNDEHVSAVWDEDHQTAFLVFWDAEGGYANLDHAGSWQASLSVKTSAGIVVIYRVDTGEVTVADPTRTLLSVQLEIGVARG